jgi:MOSC domain-containing protein YiiM
LAVLLSINAGAPAVLPGSKETTGIVKIPRSGPQLIDHAGLLGDAILNRKHHGGPDQAIYLYTDADYDFWAGELGTRPEPGLFGENLTIGGIGSSTDLAVGDRLAIGDVVLELTSHRTPCATFARRMGDPKWVRRFALALRPGAYARVLSGGSIEAGMAATHTPFAGERVTLAAYMALDGERNIPRATMERMLRAPIHVKDRARFEALLAQPETQSNSQSKTKE